MDKKLLVQALTKVLLGMTMVMLLVFVPAGDWHWREGWRFTAILFLPMIFAGFVMLFKAPELLRKRLKAKEGRSEQSLVIKLSGAMFVAGFLLAGLDHRFGWSRFPDWASWAASAVFLAGYGLYAEVLRENAFLSRTVEIQEGQKLVDTGLYGLVRHPMYLATVLLFLAMPLVLGSLVSFGVFLCYPVIIAMRIRNEEQLLRQELQGYEDYTHRVKWRMIPWVW